VKTTIWTTALLLGVGLPAGATAADELQPPAPAAKRVDFDSQIKPILQRSLLELSRSRQAQGGLLVETRESILRGGESGPGIVVGEGGESLLFELVAGLEPDRRMPAKGEPFSAEQVGLIRAWIDQGASWPVGSASGFRKARFAPRNPAIPSAPEGLLLENPSTSSSPPTPRRTGGDRLESRSPTGPSPARASLDLIGLLPTPEQLDRLRERRPARQTERFVSDRLNDRRAYADHWISFWNDALRNAYKGTGFIDDGRKTITKWLYHALYENMPYDRFVRELIDPPRRRGVHQGIAGGASSTRARLRPCRRRRTSPGIPRHEPEMRRAATIVFVNHWKLTDSYAWPASSVKSRWSSIAATSPPGKRPLSASSIRARPDRRLGARAERMKQLAEILVKPENGRLSRTIVNRLWAHMMGRGLVESLDDMDQFPGIKTFSTGLPPTSWRTATTSSIRSKRIATSRAYRSRRSAYPILPTRDAFAFKGPLTKRMTAEQYADALSTLTGVWPEPKGEMLKVDGRGQGGQVSVVRETVGRTRSRKSAPRSPSTTRCWWRSVVRVASKWSHVAIVSRPPCRPSSSPMA